MGKWRKNRRAGGWLGRSAAGWAGQQRSAFRYLKLVITCVSPSLPSPHENHQTLAHTTLAHTSTMASFIDKVRSETKLTNAYVLAHAPSDSPSAPSLPFTLHPHRSPTSSRTLSLRSRTAARSPPATSSRRTTPSRAPSTSASSAARVSGRWYEALHPCLPRCS